MSKLQKKSKTARAYFGSFIFDKRRELSIGTYQMAKVLGVSHGTICYWERGKTFPVSITVLQKMEVAYGGVSDFLRDMLNHDKVALSERERLQFLNIINEPHNKFFTVKGKLNRHYNHKSKSRDSCLKKFGKYLRQERIDRRIPASSIARAMGVFPSNFYRWEEGNSMPQDLIQIQRLNLLFDGDLVKVMFGQCLRRPILLPRAEREEVKRLMAEAINTSQYHSGIAGPKPKPRMRIPT